jgi:hypothetical protein
MFGLDYIDAAIFAALGATGCFLLSLLLYRYDTGKDHDRR